MHSGAGIFKPFAACDALLDVPSFAKALGYKAESLLQEILAQPNNNPPFSAESR